MVRTLFCGKEHERRSRFPPQTVPPAILTAGTQPRLTETGTKTNLLLFFLNCIIISILCLFIYLGFWHCMSCINTCVIPHFYCAYITFQSDDQGASIDCLQLGIFWVSHLRNDCGERVPLDRSTEREHCGVSLLSTKMAAHKPPLKHQSSGQF